MFELNKNVDKDLIYKSIEWLISNKKNYGISSFPYYSHENDIESRLAWCYGDLGIAYLLVKVGRLFDNKKWSELGKEIALKASDRNISNAGVVYVDEFGFYDTGFCHGTAGIGFIFFRLNYEFGDGKLSGVANYWLQQHIQNLDSHLDCYHLLKKPDYASIGNENCYTQNIGLLEGIIGSSLVLISLLDDEFTDWSEIFLLN